MNSSLIKLFLHFSMVLSVFCDSQHFPWMYYLKYGQDVYLKPLERNETRGNETIVIPGIKIEKCVWKTPKLIDLLPEQINLDKNNRYYIDIETCILKIRNIQADTNGIYHCFINEEFISKAMLNYHGPPPEDFLDEYKWNLIAGFSTAGGIIALFIFIWAINKYRYREDEARPIKTRTGRYEINTGYESSIKDLTKVHQLNAYKQSDENFGNGIDIELSNMNEFKEDINSLSDGVSTDSTTNKMHRF